MDPNAPLPSLDDQAPTWADAAVLARQWELGRLADRLDELVRSARDASTREAPVISSAPKVDWPKGHCPRPAGMVAAFFMTDATKASRSTRVRLAMAASVTRTRRYDGRARSSPTARCAWSIAISV